MSRRINCRLPQNRGAACAEVMESADKKLIERLQAGDVDALATYVESVRLQLLAFIQRRLGTGLGRKIEAEDVLQEVSAEAIRSLPQTDLSEGSVFSWLCQIAEHRIIDAHRHFFAAQKRDAGREVPLQAPATGKEGGGLINLLVASMTTPSQAFSRNVRELRLRVALEELPPDQREVLRLRYVENLPTKQIAQQLDKSDGALRVMISRCLKRLESLLDQP